MPNALTKYDTASEFLPIDSNDKPFPNNEGKSLGLIFKTSSKMEIAFS